MGRIRKINRNPAKSAKNYYVVDTCFLSEKYIPVGNVPAANKPRVRKVHKWWKEIDRQIKGGRARVYVPDLCIAESFKVLAKKYYTDNWFVSSASYRYARERLTKDVTTPAAVLKAQKRQIRYHDLPATRDIVIAVDRFYEMFLKHNHHVGVIDLIVVASAKYLMDFFDLPKAQIHIVTLDRPLWRGVKKITELPNAYDPDEHPDSFERVFKS